MSDTLRARLDRPLAPALCAAGLYLLYTAVLLETYNHDPSLCVMAGGRFCDWRKTPPNLNVIGEALGYDGQFYYRLALDPFTDKRTDFGVTLDAPRHRQQRLLYPLLVWLVTAGGQPTAVPAGLIAVNLAGLCGIGWLGGVLARQAGRHALWGAAFALYPGFLVSLQGDLTEITELGLVLAAVCARGGGRHWAAAGLLALAVLARESALLLAVVGFLSYAAGRREGGRGAAAFFVLPGLTYVAWQAFLVARWHSDMTEAGHIIGYPLVGFLTFFRDVATLEGHHRQVWFAEACLILAFLAAVVASFDRTTAAAPVKLAWGLYVALAFTLSGSVWLADYDFLRMTTEVYALGLLIVLRAGGVLARVVPAAGCACWLLLAVELMAVRGTWVPSPWTKTMPGW